MSNHSYGLGVAKKIIIHARNNDYINRAWTILQSNALTLVQNPFGNYALQMGVEIWGKDFANHIFEKFYRNLQTLSKQKYSSNVIEKCLEVGGDVIIFFNLRL
jgi:hypothetical protein